jgi:hypothetical protein
MLLDDDMKRYIREFRSLSLKNMEEGNIVTIMVYSPFCGHCIDQFKYFKNYMGISLDETDSKTKRERYIDRIYVLNVYTKECDNLQDKMEFRIPSTPCWIRYPELEFMCFGKQVGKGLGEITKKIGSIYTS